MPEPAKPEFDMSELNLTRQQRRKLRREHLDRGRSILLHGLPQDVSEEDAIATVLALSEGMADTSDPRRASKLAGAAEDLLERTIAPGLRAFTIGCHKGCFHCCRAPVSCTAPEIFRVAHHLREHAGVALPQLHADIAAMAATRRPLDEAALFRERVPCALLLDGACRAYASRPLPCRALYSLSSDACRLALLENQGQVPLIVPAMSKGEVVRTLMLAVITWAGLPDYGYELMAGLDVALADPGCEARWLAGEDVLAGVRRADRSAPARQAQQGLAGVLRALDR